MRDSGILREGDAVSGYPHYFRIPGKPKGEPLPPPGKSGYAYIKSRVFGLLKRYAPPKAVGRTRYRIGLVMFALPIFFAWLAPYAKPMITGYEWNEIALAGAGDALFLASLFVLGGDFWEKLRALFVHSAKAVFPETPTAAAGARSA